MLGRTSSASFFWWLLSFCRLVNFNFAVTSTPRVGQGPSIIVLDSHNRKYPFFVYNSIQGLQAVICIHDGHDQSLSCSYNTTTVLKCGAVVSATAIVEASKTVRTVGVYSYVLASYTMNGDASQSHLTLWVCKSMSCNVKSEVAVDGGSGVGSALALSTNAAGFPVIAYTSQSHQVIVKVRQCLDHFCSTFSEAPSIIAGPSNAQHETIAIGVPYSKTGRNGRQQHVPLALVHHEFNVTGGATVAKLKLSQCVNISCSAWESITIADDVSPQADLALFSADDGTNDAKFPIAIAYTDASLQKLYVTFCRTTACTIRVDKLLLNDSVATPVTPIYYPQIQVTKSGSLSLGWFQEDKKAMSAICVSIPCHVPVISNLLYEDDTYSTQNMQMSMDVDYNPFYVFSMAHTNGSFAGLYYMHCLGTACVYHEPYHPFDSNNIPPVKFAYQYQAMVFIVSSLVCLHTALFCLFVLYRFTDPSRFIARHIRMAFLQQVRLDPKVRTVSYWMLLASVLFTALCIVPWFFYFHLDWEDSQKFIVPIVPPLFLNVLLVIAVHTDTSRLRYFLVALGFGFFAAQFPLCYSFTLAWSLQTNNCAVPDLSALRTSVLTGLASLETFCISVFVFCFLLLRAIKMSSPEARQVNDPNMIEDFFGRNSPFRRRERL